MALWQLYTYLCIVLEDLCQIECHTYNLFNRQKGDLSLWTVLHVRDDSQLSFVSSLPPPSPPRLTRQRILPKLSCGLGGRTLRVVVKEVRATQDG